MVFATYERIRAKWASWAGTSQWVYSMTATTPSPFSDITYGMKALPIIISVEIGYDHFSQENITEMTPFPMFPLFYNLSYDSTSFP